MDAVKSALEEVEWDSADGQHVLYRLLCVTPFTAALDPKCELPLTHSLGRLFDTTVASPRWLRRLAVAWGRWATRNILAIAGAWRSATSVDAPEDPDPHGVAPVTPDAWVDDFGEEDGDSDDDEP